MTDNDNTSMVETIDVAPQDAATTGRWVPSAGAETLNLLQYLDLPDQASRDRICKEALAVLGKCISPRMVDANETGLVVGYVQSGKTMSFTTVTALARDNNYPLVIVIAGTSIPLFKQSENRLKKDLRLNTRSDRKWKPLSNPGVAKRQHVESALAEWRDKTVSEAGRQTVLITVMKNHTHLRNLNRLLAGLDLKGVPVLIIDDEADQAGLNTAVNSGGQSTTYRHLVELRRIVPHHSYLQYTATPQAPLLINIIDVLSPEFAEVLTPGDAYTGGKEFFGSNLRLVRSIPSAEIPSRNNNLAGPPESLQLAMRLFYLGVAAAYVAGEPDGNRSMMVHPSQKTIPHSEYAAWVRQIKAMWERLLSLPLGNPDRQDVVADFQEAYKDLQRTVSNLPSFDAIMATLPRAIRKTMIEEINSKQRDGTPQIDWKTEYSWILVGGQAMDRGFTVEGLTVTYMPRGMGVGNADTIQQRARFFGYKKSYLGYCRVFVEDLVRDAFQAYVDHEEDIRARLTEHSKTGRPLTEWKRAFFLDTGLKPTRKNVLNLPYLQDTYSDAWFIPTAPHDSPEAVQWNRQLVQALLAELTLVPDEGHSDRSEVQRHLVARNVSLAEVYTTILPFLRVPQPNDSQKFTGMLLQVGQYLDQHPDALCTVFHMSGGKTRVRRTSAEGEIPNLFQGAHPDTRGTIYRGDRYIRDDALLTIQIHNLTVRDPDGQEYVDVPAVAVWVPRSMSRDWLSQASSI